MGEQRKKRERDLTMAARNCRSRRSSTGLALQPTSAHSELVSASLSPSSFRYLDATTCPSVGTISNTRTYVAGDPFR